MRYCILLVMFFCHVVTTASEIVLFEAIDRNDSDTLAYYFSPDPFDMRDTLNVDAIYEKRRGHTLLTYATKLHKAETAKALLTFCGASVDKPNVRGVTPFHQAVMNNNFLMGCLFIMHGANVNTRKNLGKSTPLFAAIRANNIRMVALILHHGGRAIDSDGRSRTPLDIALGEHCDEELIEYLRGINRY